MHVMDRSLTVVAVSRYNVNIVTQQPLRQSRMSWPDFNKILEPQAKSRLSSQEKPEFSKERRSLVSRASKSTRSKSRPRRALSGRLTKRPAIGAPTDFRRSNASDFEDLPVDALVRSDSPPLRKLPPFRPLQLSIFVPGNELPLLPKFSDDPAEDIPAVPGIARPPQALLAPRSEALLQRSDSSFSVPRKPVPSRSNSAEPRYSTDSTLAPTEMHSHKRSFSFERSRSYSVTGRPSFATTRSNQDFVESFNAPLPPLPQPAPTNIPASERTIYRRASEQSLRLRTHLEEREALERRLPECETINEEKTPVSARSKEASPYLLPALAPSEPLLSDQQIFVEQSVQQRESIHPVVATDMTDSVISLPTVELKSQQSDRNLSRRLSQRSSSDSSTLLNEKLSSEVIVPTVVTTISAPDQDRPSTSSSTASAAINPPESQITLGQRLSQWLTRSLTTHHSHLRSRHPSKPDLPRYSRNSNGLKAGKGTHSAPNELSEPWELGAVRISSTKGKDRQTHITVTTTTSSNNNNNTGGDFSRPRGSSVSTYVTTRGLSIDLEKFPIPIVRDVGVAI